MPISLATVTRPHEISCVSLHCWPKVASFHDLSDEGLCPRVISADSPMYFFKDVPGFFLFNTSQIRLGVASFVEFVIQYRKSGGSSPYLFSFLWIIQQSSFLKECDYWARPSMVCVDGGNLKFPYARMVLFFRPPIEPLTFAIR